MAKTSLFSAVAMAAPPQTVLPGLELSRRDFRLHFAINCGSISLLPFVPIYNPCQLDDQLDEVLSELMRHGGHY